MARAPNIDPLALLRTGVNRLESGANTLATREMQSDQFSQLLGQWIKVSLGVQHVVGKVLTELYARLDVPSRTELAAVAAAVQRVEDKVSALVPAAPSPVPRPPRTRRVPESVAALETQASVPTPPVRAKRAAARKSDGKAAVKPAREAQPSRARKVRS